MRVKIEVMGEMVDSLDFNFPNLLPERLRASLLQFILELNNADIEAETERKRNLEEERRKAEAKYDVFITDDSCYSAKAEISEINSN